MSSDIIVGSAMGAFGLLLLVSAATRKAEAHEYAWAMFFAEWGAMFIVGALMPSGTARVGTNLFFAVSMALTAAMWWKLYSAYRRRRAPSENTRSFLG